MIHSLGKTHFESVLLRVEWEQKIKILLVVNYEKSLETHFQIAEYAYNVLTIFIAFIAGGQVC